MPAPRHLTLERQLNKSVLIGWNAPEPPGQNQIESYHVYVDGVLKVTVKATERTRALVEGVDSTRVRHPDLANGNILILTYSLVSSRTASAFAVSRRTGARRAMPPAR